MHPAITTLFSSHPRGVADAECYLSQIQPFRDSEPTHVPFLGAVMDANVVQNIELCPTTTTKNVESLLDNSPECIQQLSPISFWDSLDTPIDFGATRPLSPIIAAHAPRSQKTDLTGASAAKANPFSSSTAPRASKTLKPTRSSSKRPHTPERKRSRSSQAPSALDSSDYWLRFDSDDESLDRAGELLEQAPSIKRRPLSLISPEPRNALVGGAGSFKLAFPGAFDGPVDDSALDHALSDEDDALSLTLDEDFMKRGSSQPEAVAPERLYSTPLSWEPPQPGLQMDSYFPMTQPLSDPERQRLLAIAMGTGMAPGAARGPTNLSMDFDFDIHQSPKTFSDTKSSGSDHKRKGSQTSRPTMPLVRSGLTTPTEPADKPKDKTRSSERAAHNDIERKYRTNLKDRIAELREAIPSLRSIPEDGDEDGDSPVMQSRAPKVSKGTVLTKATEYIHQLERRNRSMSQKNDELTRRLQAFEQLLGAGPSPTNWQTQSYSTPVFNPNTRGFPS